MNNEKTKALPDWADFERIDHDDGRITYESHGNEDMDIELMGNTFICIDGWRAKTVAETIHKALSQPEPVSVESLLSEASEKQSVYKHGSLHHAEIIEDRKRLILDLNSKGMLNNMVGESNE